MPDESDMLATPLVQLLLTTHPNTHALHPIPLPHTPWPDLVRSYAGTAIPGTAFAQLIASIRRVQLPRAPIHIHALPLSTQGMSPKKAHEVARMAAYVVRLAHSLDPHLHIVDVGAGQGYLTRTLKAHLPHAHILALDADTEQTRGAQRWEQRLLPDADPKIDHRVVYISPETLLGTVDEWIADQGEPVPVLLVALHACGSLTPDVLRAFVAATKQRRKTWYPAGVVAVGCCYNLMNPSDYPPSTSHLPISAYHLAAQIPSQWLLPGSTTIDPAVELSIRKVTWRALLAKSLENSKPADPAPSLTSNTKSATVPARWSSPSIPSTSLDTEHPGALPRLGKLHNSAYGSWNAFLRAAEVRLGVTFGADEFDEEGVEGNSTRKGLNTALESELATLHVMRCLLGPAIESAILRDRVGWVRNELGIPVDDDGQSRGQHLRAELVNLFDQATGSGRNVAIVVAPEAVLPVFPEANPSTE